MTFHAFSLVTGFTSVDIFYSVSGVRMLGTSKNQLEPTKILHNVTVPGYINDLGRSL